MPGPVAQPASENNNTPQINIRLSPFTGIQQFLRIISSLEPRPGGNKVSKHAMKWVVTAQKVPDF
jgi:hypothetical protein